VALTSGVYLKQGAINMGEILEIIPLMSFKHLKMLNSASKCLKITLKVIKFSKPEKKFPKNFPP
jgi:hypothetical protein